MYDIQPMTHVFSTFQLRMRGHHVVEDAQDLAAGSGLGLGEGRRLVGL